MHYQNGMQKLIEGQPHYWDNDRRGWVNPNNGYVISEQQVQEMSYAQYQASDGANAPDPYSATYDLATNGVTKQTIAFPAFPRRGTNDYNRLIVEMWGKGGSGGTVLGTFAESRVGVSGAGGGGGGGYVRVEYNFDRKRYNGTTHDHAQGSSGNHAGVTLEYQFGSSGTADVIWSTRTGDLVLKTGPTPGAGITFRGGSGGTAAATANPDSSHFLSILAIQGATGTAAGVVGYDINGVTFHSGGKGGAGGQGVYAPYAVEFNGRGFAMGDAGRADLAQYNSGGGIGSYGASGDTADQYIARPGARFGEGGGGGATGPQGYGLQGITTGQPPYHSPVVRATWLRTKTTGRN